MAVLLPEGKQSYTNNAGVPLAGGRVYTYDAGTNTPRQTFAEAAGTTPLANPVILDARGEATIFWSGSYKVVLRDASDVIIWTVDGVSGPDVALAALIADLANTADPAKGDALIGVKTPLTGGSARTQHTKNQDAVSLADFGAVGDGVTVDTTAVQAALDSGAKLISTVPGKVYLVGPLTQSTARQVIMAYGAGFKRINASTHAAMLKLSGQGARVYGGRWDGNKANQSGSAGDKFGHSAVEIAADDCVVEAIESVDSWGIGVKGVACNYPRIAANRCIDPDLYGVYVESTAADKYGAEILDNYITSTGIAAGSGIYLTGSNSPFTFKQYLWKIRGNTCRGSTATPTGVGITTRGVDGVIAENITTGYTMGISADLAARTPIVGNRCTDMAGATGYGIELNGERCIVAGNYTKGGRYGIVGSGNASTQDYSKVSNNTIEEPSLDGIFFVATGAFTARHLDISGNTVTFTGSSTGRIGIRLAGDCKYTDIKGNKLVGPGSAIANCRGVFLDGVDSDVNISAGNRISNFERAVSLYKAGAVAYARVTLSGNDLSLDIGGGDTNFLTLEGAATYGASIVQKDNVVGSGYTRHYEDRSASILQLTGSGTPEGVVTAGMGSVFLRTDGGATTTLYIKTSGAGNTGWTAK